MKNNQKQASVTLIILVVVAIIFAAGLFLPRSFTKIFTKPFESLGSSSAKSSSKFGQLNRGGNTVMTPNQLRWKKAFVFKKKKEKKQQGSYMRYLAEKNKSRKK